MTEPRDPAEASIGTLVERLVDDGKAYARAEVDVVKRTVRDRIAFAKLAVIMGVAAIFVAQAGLTVLFVAIGSALALLVGTWAGQLISALLALAIAGGMVKYAVSHLSPPPGDHPTRGDH